MFKKAAGLRGIAAQAGREFVKVTLCLLLAELALRAYGIDPSPHLPPPHPGVIGVPDDGWVHYPGRFEFADRFSTPPRTILYTFLNDGSRDVGGKGHGPMVALLGCSFMEGYWLDDKESIGWNLQRDLPQFEIKNFGVRGYGTYLSLLAMRRIIPNLAPGASATFVYGFADFHVPRNVRNPLFQKIWGQDGNHEEGRGSYPVCDDSGCFTWSGARIDQAWKRSRLLHLVARAWESVVFLWRMPMAQRVTERLLLEMSEEAKAHGHRLIIAPTTPLVEEWRAFFKAHGFEVVSCVPAAGSASEQLLKDGHPNALWSERFSACLARYVREPNSSLSN